MIGYAYDRVRAGLRMPGLIIVPQDLSVGTAVNELVFVSRYLLPGEWGNQVVYLPIRR